ncbi:MAG: sugar phosphate isomerase/epimerase [Candidatus Omnitrophica bacterium]|nr:sugar phosphate isomerase/epimerase [Candidatus Omnitrophota bacterium]
MNKLSPYALSTAWNYRGHKDAKGIADEIKSLGFNSVELNFALTKKEVEGFVKLKDSGYINITSTHNYCPLPDGVDPKDASPEFYSLSSLDDDERLTAVKFTKKSMDFAKRLGATTLVLHLGRVDIKDKTKQLFSIMDKAKFEEIKKNALFERGSKAKPFLDKAMKSLEALLKHAGKIDLNIALENRYYIKEIPSLEEFKIIFKAMSDRHLFYWHDTGHAQIYENLSILKCNDYLKELSNHLIGVHLHDIILYNDHLAPGCGNFDFKRLKPYIKNDTIKVLEAHKGKSTPEELKRSRFFLKKVLES